MRRLVTHFACNPAWSRCLSTSSRTWCVAAACGFKRQKGSRFCADTHRRLSHHHVLVSTPNAEAVCVLNRIVLQVQRAADPAVQAQDGRQWFAPPPQPPSPSLPPSMPPKPFFFFSLALFIISLVERLASPSCIHHHPQPASCSTAACTPPSCRSPSLFFFATPNLLINCALSLQPCTKLLRDELDGPHNDKRVSIPNFTTASLFHSPSGTGTSSLRFASSWCTH